MLVSFLDAVLPTHVPTEQSLNDWLVGSRMYATVSSVGNSRHEFLTSRVLIERLTGILASFPQFGKLIEPPHGSSDDLAHDAYFHVRRFQEDEPAVFIRSILSARLTFVQEATEQATTLDNHDLELIDRGFADLLSCLTGGGVGCAPHVSQWHSQNRERSAMRRWVHGHLIFAALSQGLIFSFRAMGQAFRLGSSEETQKWADLSVSLLLASGASFVFTGDFPPSEYENSIRPSMTPPQAPLCLSGLMSADHRYMAQTIRDMRPVLKALAHVEPVRHGRIAQAISDVYDSHIFVCERFVGSRPSLLTAGRTERTGPSLIEQFKALRLKPFEPSHRISTLIPDGETVTFNECPFEN